jgi:hypothetical protein
LRTDVDPAPAADGITATALYFEVSI